MTDNLMKTINFLNSTLPRGSHLVVIGMPDGRFLWNNVHRRIHPLGKNHYDSGLSCSLTLWIKSWFTCRSYNFVLVGRLWDDVTYEDMYGFWNCLELSPCFGTSLGGLSLPNANVCFV